MSIVDRVDVVVVGAGLAGHCATLAAAESGATVALLEKTDTPGGSTITSGGSFAFGGTDAQRAAGIDDSPARLEQDLMTVSGGRAESSLVKVYVEGQFEAYEWLKQQGVIFHAVSLSSNTSVPRTHPTQPRQLINALHAKVLGHRRVRFLPRTAAEQLLVAPTDQRVVGVSASRDGGAFQLQARGVVLATGGFSRSASMVGRFAPRLQRAHAWGGVGNTGDGIAMSLGLGAALADMDTVTGTFGVAINRYPDLAVRPGDEMLLRMAMYRGAIAINLEAKRFADESLSYKKLGDLCLEQPLGVAFQIFDQPIMDQSAIAPNLNDFRDAYDKGVIRKASSVGDLSAAIGVAADNLQGTLARYNKFVELGVDEDFGRRTLGGGYGKPVQISTPPYYALPCCTALLSTYCGLKIDDRMQVLRTNGEAIRGLYAAGETVGGFHGAGYMSGSALGKAAIFGLAAGRHAAGLRHP